MENLEVTVRKPTPQEETTMKQWPTWSKEASEFNWSYSDRETCLIVEGEVEIVSGNRSWTFGAGDVVVFP